jgi:hypothetical protein
MKLSVLVCGLIALGASAALAQSADSQTEIARNTALVADAVRTSEQATTTGTPTPQQADAAAAAAESAANAEDDPLQEVVCRTERITGSLTRRRRTCMTRAEWNDIEARTQEELRRQGRQASGGVQCRQDQNGGC